MAGEHGDLCQDLQESYNTIRPPKPVRRRRGTCSWLCITSYQLIYSMITTSFALSILPQEAERLNTADTSLWLAAYVMICGATQLICPLAGLLSDRLSSTMGRRRPVMLLASLFSAAGFLSLYFCSRYEWPHPFLMSLAFTETALNVAYAAHAALPADLRAPETDVENPGDTEADAGLISGIMALHSFIGAVCAVCVLDVAKGFPLYSFYQFYGAAVVVICILVSCVAKEEPSSNLQLPSAGEIAAAYTMDRARDMDFFWVCYGRLLFYTSQSVIVFMSYFIRDMFQVTSEKEVISKLSTLVLIGQLLGAVVAVPSSRMSDHVGCKPAVYVSCVVQCITFLTFILAPMLAWNVMLIGASFYGLGSGSYMSVDYALALKCLPSNKDRAQSFGLWGIAGFIGSCLGPLVAGGVLWLFPGPDSTSLHAPQFQYKGYAFGLLLAGSLPALVVIPATKQIIRKV